MKIKPKLPTSWDDVPVIFDLPYACVLLGKSYDRLKKLCQSGQVPAHKVGREWRFEKEEMLEWLKKVKSVTWAEILALANQLGDISYSDWKKLCTVMESAFKKKKGEDKNDMD